MEIWKDVKGFEKSNEISSLGRLRTKDRLIKHSKFGTANLKRRYKKFRLNRDGYLRCNIKENGKSKDLTMHRIIAQAFIPNPKNYRNINHINGIKTDNRIENLEWCTSSQNIQHAVKTRLVKTKLTDKEAIEIHDSNLSTRKLAKKYGVSNSITWRIKNEKAYKHLW